MECLFNFNKLCVFIQFVCILGETLYIGQYEPRRYVDEYPFGVVTPSQEMIAYCDYSNTSDKELTLKICVRYEALTGTSCVVFYWKPCNDFSEKIPNYFPEDIVCSNRTRKPLFYFVARVDGVNIVKESKVVGSYAKSKFPGDFDGPLVGFGQAWYDKSTPVQGHRTPINSFKVHVPYDGKIYEVSKFSFLCSYQMPSLSHFTYPSDKWVKFYGLSLPPNAFPAGIAPDGEVLYVGRGERPNYSYPNYNILVPGYVTSWNKHLYTTWDQEELIYYDEYEVLVVENPDLFEWVVDSQGKVPRNAVVGGHGEFACLYFIGRTVTGSDPSVGTSCKDTPINLPDKRVSNTQLVGKIDRGCGSLCVAWNGEEYYYNTYEVLVLNKRYSPKNLKQLCRNAIITATMGMPDRLDQLDLPAQLKKFCKVTGRVID